VPHNLKNAFRFILIHVQLQLPDAQAQTKLHIAYLTSWHNGIFGYQLRTIEAENP